MAEHGTEKKNPNMIKMFGMVLPLLPGMIVRFGGSFLRFKGAAKKGGSIFHRELLNQGIDEATAEKLTEEYLEGSNLMKYIQFLR
ncbi:MAG: hypothetical protein NT038_01815 [Euryarchaeota archaeon]|nr:hypothetical protein [Euryarchaeota archaeon]